MRALFFACAISSLVACGGCGPKIQIHCTTSNCSGCCDASGACRPGKDVNACGANAGTCAICATGQACVSRACVFGGDAGGGAGGGSGGGAGGGVVFDGGEDCSAEAKLVYVVDQNMTLSSFDPARLIAGLDPFVDLGQLSCPAQVGGQPFSMSVDRNAVAWIVYDTGELFSVNVKTLPLTCAATSFVPQQDVAKFGMGFVSNDAGSTDETLFISGSSLTGTLATTKFGTLDTVSPYAVTVLGVLTGAPELTGTGDAKLWAFFPNVDPPRVSQLDKANGGELQSFDAVALTGSPRAWAFAFWGGDFWIFLERDTDTSTNVWRMPGQTHAVGNALPDTGRRIVGAGVSTCAPLIIN